jgi:hypothetical protein
LGLLDKHKRADCFVRLSSAAQNAQTNEGVAIKKVTNVFSKKILAKRALRELKLLQHFRGHRNVRSPLGLDDLCQKLTSMPDHMPLRHGYPTGGWLQRGVPIRGLVLDTLVLGNLNQG